MLSAKLFDNRSSEFYYFFYACCTCSNFDIKSSPYNYYFAFPLCNKKKFENKEKSKHAF